jgi:hypothetical protein
VADFQFRTGNDFDLGTWAPLVVAPSVTVRPGAGGDGGDRATLIFPDGAVVSRWLEITVLANENTGLSKPDVYYIGNAPGETGDSATDARVDLVDVVLTRDNAQPAAAIDNPFDFNRDGVVDALDEMIARENLTALVADLDDDGRVGLSDLGRMLSRYGAAAGPREGDLSGDATVGAIDVALLSADFGQEASAALLAARLKLISIPAPPEGSGSPMLVESAAGQASDRDTASPVTLRAAPLRRSSPRRCSDQLRRTAVALDLPVAHPHQPVRQRRDARVVSHQDQGLAGVVDQPT